MLPSMKVTAVLPAFNAERTLKKTYDAIPKSEVQEIILVDDASTDRTVAEAQKISDLITIIHERNLGYGGNQKTCYDAALRRGADIVVMIHPDFQYDPSFVPALLAPLRQERADLVIGSRFLSQDPRAIGMVWWRYWGNRLLTAAQNRTLGLQLSECHSGYRAYNRHLLEQVPYRAFSNNFVFDSQMLTAVARRGFRIAEVPIPARYTSESSSASLAASIRYGLQTIRTLF